MEVIFFVPGLFCGFSDFIWKNDWANWGQERFTNSSNVIWLVGVRVRIWTRSFRPQSLYSWMLRCRATPPYPPPHLVISCWLTSERGFRFPWPVQVYVHFPYCQIFRECLKTSTHPISYSLLYKITTTILGLRTVHKYKVLSVFRSILIFPL